MSSGTLRAALSLLVVVAGLGVWSVTSAGAQASGAGSTEHTAAEPETPQVNLNTASVAELQRLPGVGPARAEAIVAYRERRPFRRIEELMRIRGIGRKTFRRLRPMLTVGERVRR